MNEPPNRWLPWPQPAGAAPQHLGQIVEGVLIRVEQLTRGPLDANARGGVGLGLEPLHAGGVGAGDDDVLAAGALANGAEVGLGQFKDALRLGGAHEDGRHVFRGVVLPVVVGHVLARHHAQVGHPADDGAAVGMAGPVHGVELFVDHAGGRGLGAHAPLFLHHIDLGVVLAEDRVAEPVGLQPEEELELVGGQLHEVLRGVVAGAGVEAGTAVRLVEPPQRLALEHLLLILGDLGVLLDEGVERGGVLGREVAALPLQAALLRLEGVRLEHHPIRLGDELLILLQIGDAHGVGALEQHVLEEMRQAGAAGLLLHRAGAHEDGAEDARHAMALDDEHAHAVAEDLLFDVERLGLRGARRHGRDHPHQAGEEHVSGSHGATR
jgi:hypothetical protein